ncbi:rhamnogalacturonan lyase [Leeuwenhoekiella palythoae]|uniref:Rhamnogalacturonan endolyase n=1 Tax=Leeuwenhoekiella palythoae TaxID=573501 RepID=A0A1M5U9D1_9FLAO|nr:rhamnogalacturonan lyase [Leeuwenhoekiella palythoae]RXG27462.1 rhamnogalacturonan endolyase [Leeuwenhoekiella palythoae]SHH59466.1 rhamnogalacturonan endolyase [Leeuwenhoekiella palythoae]
MSFQFKKYGLIIVLLCLSQACIAQRLMEHLDRGVVVIPQEDQTAVVSWRVLGTDPDELHFNLYRQTGEETPQKLNTASISGGTFFIDTDIDWSKKNTWFVTSVLNGKEIKEPGTFSIAANAEHKPYLSIPLQTPDGYAPGDASTADLDGDGQYELVIHQMGRGHDNSHRGLTDDPIFQAYELSGELLWEINLGKNIREGAHYTQFLVYDFDSDGKAEMVCKTADGTTDALGNVIGDPEADWRDTDEKSRTYGKILKGPEYLTVFDGQTGKALATTDYIAPRGDISKWGGHGGNGGNDNTGNRVDRFTACVAYLDGIHPSFVMGRGYYGRTVLAAFDFKNNKISSRWVFDSENRENPYSGQGNHNLSVADADGDGKDEIIFGAMAIDDDGTGMYSTGFRHGDAIHVSDLDPDVPGLERFGIHEIENGTEGPGIALFSIKDGTVLYTAEPNRDIGRGVAANIDTTRVGAQMWWLGSHDLHDNKGKVIGKAPRSANFLIWWDGDFSRELLDRTYIAKYGKGMLFKADGATWSKGSKATPSLSADILGDWREELLLPSKEGDEMRIYSTTIPTMQRMYTLMHDPQYRLSIAWQNVGYNQPPHTGFYMGYGMKKAPKPNIKLIPETID